MWSIRSSSSKTFSWASYSFVCSKCLTSSAIRAASPSTSSSVGIGSGMRSARLNGVRFGYFVHCQLAGHPQNFREQSGDAGTEVHSEIGFYRLHCEDVNFLRQYLKLLEDDEEIFPVDHARGCLDHPGLNLP